MVQLSVGGCADGLGVFFSGADAHVLVYVHVRPAKEIKEANRQLLRPRLRWTKVSRAHEEENAPEFYDQEEAMLTHIPGIPGQAALMEDMFSSTVFGQHFRTV